MQVSKHLFFIDNPNTASLVSLDLRGATSNQTFAYIYVRPNLPGKLGQARLKPSVSLGLPLVEQPTNRTLLSLSLGFHFFPSRLAYLQGINTGSS